MELASLAWLEEARLSLPTPQVGEDMHKLASHVVDSVQNAAWRSFLKRLADTIKPHIILALAFRRSKLGSAQRLCGQLRKGLDFLFSSD